MSMETGSEQAGGVRPDAGQDASGEQQESVMQCSRREISGALLSLLDMRRAHFGAHCRRVAEWSGAIGKLSGLSREEQEELEAAALLHDVGFIAASGDRLLMGPVSDKGGNRPPHYMVGYSILNDITGFERIAKAVLHHHEHYDGTGYPQGLQGDKIPMMARVIAVADAYDLEMHPGLGMMASDEDMARHSMVRLQGYRLDPDLVNRFLFALANIDPIRRRGDEEFEITPTALAPGMILSRDLRTLSNVLLLKANTVLTRDRINKLLTSEKMDWLTARAYVDTHSIRDEELPAEERKPQRVAGKTGVFGHDGSKEKVRASLLALDDSMAVCNALRRELGRSGIDVISATDVKSAIALLATRHFDAAVTDIVMGDQDGFVFLNEIKDKCPWLHVVVLSGHPSAENVRALKEFNNVVRFVTKPWEEELLLASVEEAITMTRDARSVRTDAN